MAGTGPEMMSMVATTDLGDDARAEMMRSIADQAMTFTDEQKAELTQALFTAELSLLRAITREAERLESFDAARNIPRLVTALRGLRSSMGQAPVPLWAATAGGRHYFTDHDADFFDDEDDDISDD